MSLQLNPLSDEAIAKHNYQMADLWMLQVGSDVMGPFHTSQLLEESYNKNPALEHARACNLAQEEIWNGFYSWPIFQRRAPKLVPVVELVTESAFYILKNGVKLGPFDLTEMENKYSNGEITCHDLICSEENPDWIKMCEHHHFDRRIKIEGPLPGRPAADLMEPDEHKIVSLISKKTEEREQEDALVGLAFVISGNDKGQTFQEGVQQVHSIQAHTSPAQMVKTQFKFSMPKISFIGLLDWWNDVRNLSWEDIKNWRPSLDQLPESFKQNKATAISVASIAVILFFFTIMNSFNNSFDQGHDITFVREKKPVKLDVEAQGVSRRERDLARAGLDPAQVKPEIPKVDKQEKKVAKEEPVDDGVFDYAELDERYPYETEPTVYETAEVVDLDDPDVRDEISRELAGDIDSAQLSEKEIKFLEKQRAYQNDLEAERQMLDKLERNPEYREEQVSDFE